MPRFIDLSHDFEDGLPGFKLKSPDGSVTQFTAQIRPFLTHAQTLPLYEGRASFEITELRCQTSVGTYLDAPCHRHPGARSIGDLAIEELVAPGVVLDVRGRAPFEPVGVRDVALDVPIEGKAVLFNFGWSGHFGTEAYESYPYIDEELVRLLVERRPRIVGVDTINIDDRHDLSRPAHTRFLKEEIFILENLTRLELLHGRSFRLFAVPVKAMRAAAMPVRAFAECDEGP